MFSINGTFNHNYKRTSNFKKQQKKTPKKQTFLPVLLSRAKRNKSFCSFFSENSPPFCQPLLQLFSLLPEVSPLLLPPPISFFPKLFIANLRVACGSLCSTHPPDKTEKQAVQKSSGVTGVIEGCRCTICMGKEERELAWQGVWVCVRVGECSRRDAC